MDIGIEASMNLHKVHYGKQLFFHVWNSKIYLGIPLNCMPHMLSWRDGKVAPKCFSFTKVK